jgi:hypothetical protein
VPLMVAAVGSAPARAGVWVQERTRADGHTRFTTHGPHRCNQLSHIFKVPETREDVRERQCGSAQCTFKGIERGRCERQKGYSVLG